MGWTFTSYERIGESAKRWQVSVVEQRKIGRMDWCVTEKIHGANFCFILEPSGILCAKRKALLPSDEDFFGHKRILHQIRDQLAAVRGALFAREPEGVRGFVYGELFGGGYPHPEVEPDPAAEPVQTGVWYAPGVHFCAFDLAMETREGAESHLYLDYDEALAIFAEAGLFCAEPLFVGGFEEAMATEVGFDSTIPGRLGLPPLDVPNAAEGIVIKPVKTVYVETGKGLVRPVLKKKIAAFAEDARYSQAEAWSQAAQGADPLTILEWEMGHLINPNRVNSALSKLGRLAPRDEGAVEALRKMVVDDVIESLGEDFEGEMRAISDEERRLLVEVIHDEVEAAVAAFLSAP